MSILPASHPTATQQAVTVLEQGHLLGLPTETVYGLAADASNPQAVAAIYGAKGRPSFNPLIAHLPSFAAAQAHGHFNAAASKLAQAFWPGPLTLVVPFNQTSAVCPLARAGLNTIGLRVPSHPVACAVLKAFGKPVAAPSANRSGHVSATTAQHVKADLSNAISLILDAGPTPAGLESTILDCTTPSPRLLRPGALPRDAIEALLGHPLGTAEIVEKPTAPGQLASHYAPGAPVRLNALQVHAGEALLAFGPTLPPGHQHATAVINLSPTANLTEAAANLFQALRALDESAPTAIAAMPIPATGLGEAITDRLARAAAPR